MGSNLQKNVVGILVLAVVLNLEARDLQPVLVQVEPESPFEQTDNRADTLRFDDGVPTYAFRFPDAYGDDLRNMRFRAPYACLLRAAMFAFPTRNFRAWTTGTPDLVVMVWPMGPDSLPLANQCLLADTIPFAQFSTSVFDLDSVWRGRASQFVIVDLSAHNVVLDSGAWFHVGYSAVLDPGDSLAILSDDGNPQTSYASEWYNGRFVLMREGWLGVNLFIRAVVESGSGDIRVLEPLAREPGFKLKGVFPNPFNMRTRIAFELARGQNVRITVHDILGREKLLLLQGFFPAGRHVAELQAVDWPTGIYFVRLKTGTGTQTARLVLEK